MSLSEKPGRRLAKRFRPDWAAMALLCLLVSAGQTFGLDPDRDISQYTCRNWNRQNGLPGNGVNAIAQTADGYIWLGTSAGLVRFDGIEFDMHASRLRTPTVTALAAAPHGGLWLGLRDGAFAFSDGRNVTAWSQDEWGGSNLNVNALLESSNGELWVAATGFAGKLNQAKNFQGVLTSDGNTNYFDVHAICEDTHGRIWLGTAQGGVYYWQNGALTKFSDAVLDEVLIHTIAEDKDGGMWFTTDQGLVRLDANLKRVPAPTTPSEPRSLLVDRHGAVWIGTAGSGLLRYQNGVLSQFRKAGGLVDDFVSALAEDKEGNLWIGTPNGLSQLSDVKIPTVGKAEGLAADMYVSVVASHKGGLWLATGNGFTYYNGETNIQAYAAESLGMGNGYVGTIFEAANGDIYLVNGVREILIVSGGKIVARYPNKAWPTAMIEDSKGVIVSVDGKLYRVSPTSYTPYLLPDGQEAVLNYTFNLTLARDGSIWAATGDGVYQLGTNGIKHWATGKALWICEDNQNVIWAGLLAGIARINGENEDDDRIITENDGLFGNTIFAMVLDDYDHFWVNSDRGLFRADLKSLNDFCDGKTKHIACETFSKLNEVKSIERNEQKSSGCKTLDGRIWFPTAQGVVSINPTNIPVSAVPPEVHIDVARANGRTLEGTAKAVVPPGRGELEFHYVGLSYADPQQVRYRYKLDGYDKEWVDGEGRRMALYANLKPGQYQFRVIAANADGIWSAAGDSLGIELQPHFYQTVLFDVCCVGAGLALLGGIYAWRVRHLNRNQRALQQARDRLETEVAHRTAELRERTASLEKEIEERKRMQQEIERVHRELLQASRLAGMAEVATGVLHNVGNVLNSVNVSTTLVTERIRKSKITSVGRIAALLKEHGGDLGTFMTTHPKGQRLPSYLSDLSEQLSREQGEALEELSALHKNLDHIKDIVAVQQGYAKVAGVTTQENVVSLFEDALRMDEAALKRHNVTLVREFEEGLPQITVDRHKVVQILVNLIRNAKHACNESHREDKQLTLRLANGAGRVKFSVSDNGVGIPPENFTRIFSHGFTTRRDGHGFGLHSGALAAREMGGELKVYSEGTNKGATFTLELPLQPPTTS
jgi:ligand-binding sensor domain-containing protein/signal transduction histidine kinase